MDETEICCYCSAPAVARCAWPEPKVLKVAATTVRRGDTLAKVPGDGKIVQVIGYSGDLRRCPRDGAVSLHFLVRLPGRSYPYWFAFLASGRVSIVGLGPCGRPVCEAHGRDVGVHYCLDHWECWQDVDLTCGSYQRATS